MLNGSKPPESEPAVIDWNEAVREGKEIRAAADKGELRLGELADKVEPKYGEKTLKKYGEAIGVAECTLARHRDVYRAWKDEISAPGRKLDGLKYSVARELATHPDRAEIVASNPNITKREASRKMRQWKKEEERAKVMANPAARRREQTERWCEDISELATQAISKAAISDSNPTPMQRQAVREVVKPKLLLILRDGGEALIRLAEFLEDLLQEEPPAPLLLLPPPASKGRKKSTGNTRGISATAA